MEAVKKTYSEVMEEMMFNNIYDVKKGLLIAEFKIKSINERIRLVEERIEKQDEKINKTLLKINNIQEKFNIGKNAI